MAKRVIKKSKTTVLIGGRVFRKTITIEEIIIAQETIDLTKERETPTPTLYSTD